MLKAGGLDAVAVTDHDRLDFALALRAELGERIIVGEEVTTTDGHVIGLYLKEPVLPGQSAAATADAIHAQGGLVYIPHPFDKFRTGVSHDVLDSMADKIDIVEAYNGRVILRAPAIRARHWAAARRLPTASSSDAHGRRGWGRTYSLISQMPQHKKLKLLLVKAELVGGAVGVRGRLYPKYNRLRKRLKT